MAGLNPKWLIGRTIVAVDMGTVQVPENSANPSGPKRTMHYPSIRLDNGATLSFMAEEHPDGEDYGIAIQYIKPR